MKLNELTIIQALEGLKEKQYSSVELTQACLERIKEVDNKVKAYITVCERQAINQAKEADELIKKDSLAFEKYPLLGIPYCLKDNFCTHGIKTTASSKILENYFPPYDATVVKKLKEAGAILLGKTNMDAWAHGSSTETSDFFTTRNPWDVNRLPGGSSGGSAAAVIADMAIFGIGSETAGSIRQPSSWCGNTGFKPTYGRVSRWGLISMCSSTDCPGPIVKNITDAAMIMKVLAGKDEFDATTSAKLVPDYLVSLKNLRFKDLKIGVPKEYFMPQMDKETNIAVKMALKILEKQGAKIEEVSLIDPKYSIAVYTIIQRSEVSSNLARFDGIRYGNNRLAFGKEAKNRMMLGTYTLSAGYYDQYYLKAQKVRTLICEDFEKVFKKVDVLISPTTPTPALLCGATKNNSMFGEMQDVLAEASSLAGLPGVNLPCGFTKNNLPIGMQIIGQKFFEELLLQLGYQYQEITDFHLKNPRCLEQDTPGVSNNE